MGARLKGLMTEKVRFGLIQIFYWSTVAAFGAFAVALARSKGISATYIGIMAATYRLSAVVGQFFFGALCDKLQKNRLVFMLTNILAVGASLLFFFSDAMWAVLITYALMGFFQSPTSSNLDTWILKRFASDGRAYGPIRSMGSLGYGFFVFFFGLIITNVGYVGMPICLCVTAAVTILVSWFTPEVERAETVKERASGGSGGIKLLLTNRKYLFLLTVLLFEGLSVMSVMSMKVLIWEHLGASITTFQGIDGFALALAQFPMIFISSRLTKINPYFRVLIATTLDFLMLLFVFLANAPQIVVMCSILHGCAYGFLLPAMRQIIFDNTDPGLRTTAQGIGDAAYMSISGVIGGLAAGAIADSLGIKSLVAICALVQLVPVTLMLVRVLSMRKERAKVAI